MLEISTIHGDNGQVVMGHHVLLYKGNLLAFNSIVRQKRK